MAEQKEMSDTEKLIWVLVALFLGIIGAIVYYFVVKRGKYEVEIKVKKKEQKEE
jgi:cell division protein FtsL